MQQAEIDAFQFVGQDIPWLLNHWADAAPDRPFLVWEPRSGEDRTWTYRQFVDDVEKVASRRRAGSWSRHRTGQSRDRPR